MDESVTEALAPLSIRSAVEIVVLDRSAARPEAAFGADFEASNERASSAEHIAALAVGPGRWLWLNAGADAAVRAAGTGASVVDVEGKWTAFTCGGGRARGALAATVDVDRVLQTRGCASLTLFDCPAVLAREGPDGFIICVQSSYAASFAAAYAAALDLELTSGAVGSSNTATGCATMPAAPPEFSDGGAGVR